jgi:hypothetical protein
MRKMLLTPLIVCMFAFLSTLSVPLVHAKEPISVGGIWSWTTSDEKIKFSNGNMFFSALEHDTFEGDFAGTGEGVFTVVVHIGGFMTGNGRTIFTGTVKPLDKSGTLEILWTGNTKNDQGWWWFEWVIISGTEDLANLQGQGICWGPGPEGVELSGKIVFAPT